MVKAFSVDFVENGYILSVTMTTKTKRFSRIDSDEQLEELHYVGDSNENLLYNLRRLLSEDNKEYGEILLPFTESSSEDDNKEQNDE